MTSYAHRPLGDGLDAVGEVLVAEGQGDQAARSGVHGGGEEAGAWLSVVTRMTPTAGKRRATSRTSSSAGTGPMRSWTITTSGSSSTDSADRRARVSTSCVESVTGVTGSASGSWLSRVVRERTASASPTAGRILVGMGGGLSLVRGEFVRTVLFGDRGGSAGRHQGEPDAFGERLGVRDALGVEGRQREGDRDGVGGLLSAFVPVRVQGGDVADVEDAGVGDDDLRLVGVALAGALEGGVDVDGGTRSDLPATPVAASIMMATSCWPGWRAGWSTIMSLWSREPFFSVVTAILPRMSARSVTAFAESQRSGISTFSNWPAVSGV